VELFLQILLEWVRCVALTIILEAHLSVNDTQNTHSLILFTVSNLHVRSSVVLWLDYIAMKNVMVWGLDNNGKGAQGGSKRWTWADELFIVTYVLIDCIFLV
jgi:hypothetical protein